MRKIYLDPDETWDYFEENEESLKKSLDLIAEDTDLGVSIYITSADTTEGVFPEFTVYLDDQEFYSEVVDRMEDCEATAESIYDEFLDPATVMDYMFQFGYNPTKPVDYVYESDDGITAAEYTAVEKRETELEDAARDFLLSILNDNPENELGVVTTEKLCDDLIETVCGFLYREWEISVYRPTVLETANGKTFVEYPYEEGVA